MAHNALPEAGFKKLEEFIRSSAMDESSLIKVLYEAQRIFGYLPRDVVFFISEKLDVPVSKIHGVISFYSFFTTEPKGRYQVKVCMGTACFVRGSEKIARELEARLGIKMGETSQDHQYSLEALRCVGACGLAPVVLVNDEVYGKAEPGDIAGIIENHRE